LTNAILYRGRYENMANDTVNLYDLFKKSEFGKKDDNRIDDIYALWDGKLPKIVVEHLEERERMITFLTFRCLEKY
jgi:hypothetical protein